MNWGSLDEFLAMGGYGLYVWGSFGVCRWCLLSSSAGVGNGVALRELPLKRDHIMKPRHQRLIAIAAGVAAGRRSPRRWC